MSQQLKQQICATLKARTQWEERQIVWRQMRRDGLRRRRKPYPGAADLHFPLISMQVEKLKPFYYGQAFSADLLARFNGLVPELRGTEMSCAEWFDYQLKNTGNWSTELFYLIDHMLVSGRGVMKARWCNQKKAVLFEALDPLFVIVPEYVTDLDESPWIVHVKQLTKQQYQGEKYYEQSLLKQICGKSDEVQGDSDAYRRAGITEGEDDNQVVLWEVWEKSEDGYIVSTFSPKAPDSHVRMPFKASVDQFVDFPFELAERGWYAAMGVAEHQAPFESWCCKMWNGKADAMDFFNKPLFTTSGQIRNTSNLRFAPGELMPDGIAPVVMPSPPISFDTELQMTHRLAQESISMPDANIGSEIKSRDNPTATEVQYRQQLSAQGITMRGMIFRNSLARTYKMAWALMLENQPDLIAAYSAKMNRQLTPQALIEAFLIEPDGSVDTWNRDARSQKAVNRMQMFANHPNINQAELAKSVLESEDARLVKTLWQDDAQKQANEQEDEAMEIVLLMSGFPAKVNPGENHQLRISLLTGKLQQLAMTGAPVDPIAAQRIQEHIAQHLQLLKQENPALAGQIEQAAMELDPAPAQQLAVGPNEPQPMADQPPMEAQPAL